MVAQESVARCFGMELLFVTKSEDLDRKVRCLTSLHQCSTFPFDLHNTTALLRRCALKERMQHAPACISIYDRPVTVPGLRDSSHGAQTPAPSARRRRR
ncbi:uncharacterized protein LOC100501967 [Zea mays]|uniref:Uncharacterized protein n=1 Tax=Zea mays TaxID=4577 RepID=C4J7G7_MAIZE|nr:uncharacterized protein LOC100501967 [Zea mays]ACR37117.1 unknown [Zea mays]|eukprot:NP_001183505.1 uncharacterized protein LOC100501967 [Zea mays]